MINEYRKCRTSDDSCLNNLIVGIDASRNRSGGAIAHLVGLISEGDPLCVGIIEIHVWAYRALLEALPNKPWLIKHNPPELESSLLKQLWWQRFTFPMEVRSTGCQIVLNTDAGTISSVRPAVTMSRDMLSYEPGVSKLFGFTLARLRLFLLRHIQNRSLRFADGAIFLTQYAGKLIQQSCGELKSVAYIPHGVGEAFKSIHPLNVWPSEGERPIRCIYISNAELYKHQWKVVEAVHFLRSRGYNLVLRLVGGGRGTAQRILQNVVSVLDPNREFVEQLDFLPQNELPIHLAQSDLFIFASSCENMPNTLLEAMAVGLPIACSDRGPMPEILQNAGSYFDPEDSKSIARAIEKLIVDKSFRNAISERAKMLADQYSWSRCSNETFRYLKKVTLSLNEFKENNSF